MSTPLRLLVVEDTDEVAEALAEEFRRGGYAPSVRRVDEPASMRDALSESEWDLVLAACGLTHFSARAALMLLQNTGCEIPFIVVAEKGDESQAAAIMRAGGHDYVRRDQLMRLMPAVERELAYAARRDAHDRADDEIHRREQYLKCLTDLSTELLVAGDLDASLPRVLERLRQVTEADRCYLFENHREHDGEPVASLRFENWLEGVDPRGNTLLGCQLPFREAGFARWIDVLSSGGVIAGPTAAFPAAERLRLEPLGVSWLVVLPLRVEGEWHGFLGFDACHGSQQWSEHEIGLLRAAAGSISVAIARLQAEERLRESEARYRALAENTYDLICEVSLDGRILYLSPNVGDVLGFQDGDLAGQHFVDFIHPDDRDDLLVQFARIEGAGSTGRVTFRARHRSGEWRWFESTGKTFQAATGETRAVAVCRDVTERQWAEDRIGRLNRVVRAIRDIDRLITRETDRDSLLAQACEILLGVGDYRRVWIDPIPGAESLGPFALQLDGGAGPRLSITICSGEQRFGTLHVGAKPGAVFDDEEIELLVEVADDLGFALAVMATAAERKRGAALLAGQNRVLEMVAAGAPLAAVLTALSRMIEQRMNGARCAILMLHEDGVRLQIGAAPALSEAYARAIDSSRGEAEGAVFGAAAIRGESVVQADLHDGGSGQRAAAREIGLRAAWSIPIQSLQDRTIGAVDLYFDAPRLADDASLAVLETTTHLAGIAIERWRAEERLRRYHDHLKALVETRTTELAAINKELEAFCYSVSHDLRGPLRSIDGFSQVLLEDYGDRLDDEGRRSLHRVRAATQRMAQLIDDLLELSRVTRSEMRWETVDLSLVARAVVDDLQAAHRERSVSVQIDDGLVGHGDSRLLRVVLENLLGNAWKFTAKHPHACIQFGVEQANGERTYFVHDDGAGFDMAYADKLFGAFQRLHGTHEFDGLGIGLATVARVIQRHGGRVWASGAVEQGATFYFTLRPMETAMVGTVINPTHEDPVPVSATVQATAELRIES